MVTVVTFSNAWDIKTRVILQLTHLLVGLPRQSVALPPVCHLALPAYPTQMMLVHVYHVHLKQSVPAGLIQPEWWMRLLSYASKNATQTGLVTPTEIA